MSRFIVFGDAHFGAGDSYGRNPGDRLNDQRAALEQVVEVAIERNVDGVLFAGDAFEGPIVWSEVEHAFREPLRALNAAGIPLVGISGNGRHDCAMRSTNALRNVTEMDVHTEPGVVEIAGTYIAMLPWASNARLVATRGGGDRDATNEELGALLVQVARGLYEQIPAGAPSLLLGHWSLTGSHLPNGLPVDDLREPVISTPDLEAVGFDVNVFGHIHVPGPVAVGVGERTLYTGPLTTNSFGEVAEHGCWQIELGADVFGGMEYEFIPITERPFVTHDLDLTTDDGVFDLANLPDVTDAVVRVRYTASEEQARRFDHSEWTRDLYAAGAHRVYSIQPTIVRENRARVESVTEDVGPLDALAMWAEAEQLGEHEQRSLVDLTSRYLDAVATS